MNARQLEAFRATIRCGSITAAAQAMRISQPSVSRLIADLEAATGFPLFVRAGRGLAPTVEGRRFYQGVESLFTGIERIEELAKSIGDAKGGAIAIGAIQSIATTELPIAISRFYSVSPDNGFIIHSRNTPAILDAVQMRQLDIGIVGREPGYDGFEVLFQISAPYVCLLPEEHPLANEPGQVDLETLAASETFVTFGGAYPDTMLSIDADLSQRLRKRSRLSVTNAPVAAALVREVGVLAIADPFSAEQAVRVGGVVFRPLKQNLTYFVAVVAAGREHLSQQALAFAELFIGQLESRVRQVEALGR